MKLVIWHNHSNIAHEDGMNVIYAINVPNIILLLLPPYDEDFNKCCLKDR